MAFTASPFYGNREIVNFLRATSINFHSEIMPWFKSTASVLVSTEIKRTKIDVNELFMARTST